MHRESADSAEPPFASRRLLLVLVAAGLALRLLCLAIVEYRVDRGDAVEYNRYAFNLLDHGVFSMAESAPFEPSVVRPPGYPAFLAAVYSLTRSRGQLPVQLAQIAFNLACALVLAHAVARLDRRAGRFMLFIGLLSPWDAIYNGAHLAESMTTGFLMLGLSAPILARNRRVGLFAGGALIACAILCRDVYTAFVPMIAFGILVGAERYCRRTPAPIGERALRAGLFVAGAVVVILPWSLRNRAVTGRFIPTSQGILGQALWTGSWEVSGEWFTPNWEHDLSPACCRTPDEMERARAAFRIPMGPEREKVLLQLAIDRYKSEPFAVLARWVRRAPKLWAGSRIDLFAFRPAWLARGTPVWFAMKAALVLANVGGALVGIVGILLALRRRSPLLYIAAPVVYTVGIFFPLHSTEVRYSTPAFSFLLLFTALALAALADSIREARRGAPRA